MKRRAMCSVARPRCAAAWRKTTRCRRRSPWCAARGRRRICSPSRPQRFRRTSGTRVSGPPITTDSAVGIIGPGRAGLGLGLALARAGYVARLYGRRKQAIPDPLELTVGAADAPPPPAWLAQAGAVIFAVRADATRPLAEALARGGAVRSEHVVLHLSGAPGQEALGPLVPSPAALGALHPLQTIAEPERAPERLRGAWAAVEGRRRGVQAAEGLAQELGMRRFRIASRAKAIYHAGAVFASNSLVVVEAVAQRLLRHAGLSDAEAWQALRPLVEGTLENLTRQEPAAALTGPAARGDEETIRRHLDVLTRDDAALYRALGRTALELAQKRGLDEATAARVAAALATDLPPVLRPEVKT